MKQLDVKIKDLKLIAEGGEGFVYEYKQNYVVKIYKPDVVDLRSKEIRAKLLMKTTLPDEVIKPLDLVTDNSGKFIGIVMQKVDGEDFKKLSNKKYVTSNNINTKDVLQFLERFWEIIKELHRNNIYIGDLNDQNVQFNLKSRKIFLIDCDSWTIGTEKCQVAMDMFKDPQLVKDNFNEQTDIYSFCILAWKSLTRIHPFGGVMNPDVSLIDRMKKRISVIDNQKVVIPRTTKTWKNLSPQMVDGFKKVFESGDRSFGEYISEMLGNLTYCKKDDDYYFGEFSSCPLCDASAKIIAKAILSGVENGFKIAKILKDKDVKMVFSSTIYLNNNDEVVDIESGTKVKKSKGIFLFNDSGEYIRYDNNCIQLKSKGQDTIIPIKRGSHVVADSNKFYYISDNSFFTSMEILSSGVGAKTFQKCSNNVYFNVESEKYCIVNIYDGKLIINIDGYFTTIDFNKKIRNSAQIYDSILDRWLILIEDTSSIYHSYVVDKNEIKWSSNKVTYKCEVTNVDFDRGVIYIPVAGAIRGFNYKTFNYKDFSCSVVDSSSKLIKKNNQFVIVNDDNIYRFYK